MPAFPFAVLSAEVDLLGSANVYFPTEDHRLPASVTDYPVESGKSLSDNYVREPVEIVLEGIVSSVRAGVKTGDAAVVWDRLDQLRGTTLCTVATHIRSYPNMAIVEVQTKREKGIRNLLFKLSFREVLLAVSETASLVSSIVSASGPAANRTSTVAGGRRVAPVVAAPQFSLDILGTGGGSGIALT